MLLPLCAALSAAGCCMVICTSTRPEEILDILGGARKGTKFHPLAHSLKGRKRWLLTGVWRCALVCVCWCVVCGMAHGGGCLMC
jgi:glutamate 5-kinase